MSLSWPSRLYVALAPSRIDVMRAGGLLRRSRAAVELFPGAASVADPAWRGALQTLADALPDLAPCGARVRVVLSNHFCRYATVPADIGLADETEAEAYARLRLERIYGAAAVAGWSVRLGAAPAGQARLACAVDRALLEALRRMCGDAGLTLASVRPLLAASFDRWRARFTGPRFWFAAAEEGRVCLAAIEDYGWRSVVSQRIGRNFAEEFRAMLDRALLGAAGAAPASVYLFSRDHPEERMRALTGVTVLALGRGERDSADDIARGRVFA